MFIIYEDPPLFPRPPLFALLLTFGTHLTPGMPCDVAFYLQDGRTPLRAASAAGHIDCVKLLLDGGTQANHHDEVGAVQGWIQGIWTCVVIVWGRILLVVWRRIPMVELFHHHLPHLNHGPQWWRWSRSLHHGLPQWWSWSRSLHHGLPQWWSWSHSLDHGLPQWWSCSHSLDHGLPQWLSWSHSLHHGLPQWWS